MAESSGSGGTRGWSARSGVRQLCQGVRSGQLGRRHVGVCVVWLGTRLARSVGWLPGSGASQGDDAPIGPSPR
jgi:DNA invertase Pin-like site-specific DNA recombinase